MKQRTDIDLSWRTEWMLDLLEFLSEGCQRLGWGKCKRLGGKVYNDMINWVRSSM